ncbi:hypothetical protein C942_03212 [Photobacterium marinum]|uniref:Uncharacterized protein n=1 Tax=Photobacterium marinum TaxID=1056511 RepID=L8J6Q1_9GAMM|nr:hypothetical protein C942_03212 [Photobacterium marinum]
MGDHTRHFTSPASNTQIWICKNKPVHGVSLIDNDTSRCIFATSPLICIQCAKVHSPENKHLIN